MSISIKSSKESIFIPSHQWGGSILIFGDPFKELGNKQKHINMDKKYFMDISKNKGRSSRPLK